MLARFEQGKKSPQKAPQKTPAMKNCVLRKKWVDNWRALLYIYPQFIFCGDDKVNARCVCVKRAAGRCEAAETNGPLSLEPFR